MAGRECTHSNDTPIANIFQAGKVFGTPSTLTAHYVHADFTGASVAYVAASHEDALMFRMQAIY
jgi:hypothetical protein